jgi:hypothetical protein
MFLNAPAKRVTKTVDKIKIPLIKQFLDLLRKINLPRISIQFFSSEFKHEICFLNFPTLGMKNGSLKAIVVSLHSL